MAVDQSLETGVALSLLLPASCENVVEPVREGLELRLGELARAIGREPKALFGRHHCENLSRALDDISRDRFRDRGPLDRRALARLGGEIRLFRLGAGQASAAPAHVLALISGLGGTGEGHLERSGPGSNGV